MFDDASETAALVTGPGGVPAPSLRFEMVRSDDWVLTYRMTFPAPVLAAGCRLGPLSEYQALDRRETIARTLRLLDAFFNPMCNACVGNGHVAEQDGFDNPEPCPSCDGSGRRRRRPDAHRVCPVADEELAAWDEFITDVKSRPKIERVTR